MSNVQRAIPYFGSGGGETRRVDGLPRSFSCGRGSGNGGKEMKIRYVFILLIIIVLALFKKMAD